MISHAALLGALVGTAYAGTILWDGRFNEFSTSTDLTKWSWSNQVGPYQYYIHGSGAVTEYVNLSPTYKNPADTASKQGVKITIDSTAKWNSDMWRTELIPQTTAAINKGHVYYHFSIKRSSTNVPSATNEHQICFFESHFTELKYGWVNGESGTTDTNLQWMVSSTGKWKTTFDADVWHNVAYEIDFSGGTVTFWHSTGSDPLTKTAGPFSASASSNGEDWHLGVLRLPRSGNDGTGAEDWYFSGVYIETGSLTTSVTGPGGSSSGSSSGSSAAGATDATVAGTTAVATTAVATTAVATTAVATTLQTITAAQTTMAASGGTTTGTVAQYGQCGGTGYSGDTGCVSGYTCTKVNDYYSQCL